MPLSLTPTVPGTVSLGVTSPGRLGLVNWGLTNVTDGFAAVGDGVTDDASALNAAISQNHVIYAPPGLTFLVGTTWTISASNVIVDFSNSTVKKKSTLATAAITVTGTNVTIRNLVVDGNRSGGATLGGIRWTGAGGRMENVSVSACAYTGVEVTGASAAVTCVSCTSSNNGLGAGTADGFATASSGVIQVFGCIANSNDRAGYFLAGGDGSHIDGYAANNREPGLWIFSANNGTVGTFNGYDNGYWDVYFSDEGTVDVSTPSGWDCGTIISENNGHTNPLVAGTGAGLYFSGCKRNRVGTLIAKGGIGWACVFAGAEDCSVGQVIADNLGSPDTDPCVTIAQSSKHCSVGTIVCRNFSIALTISEEDSPFHNDYNTVGDIHAYGCLYGIVSITGGSYNRIGRVIGYGCGNADTTLMKGLVHIDKQAAASADDVQGNVIDWLEHRNDSTTTANSLVYCASTISRNYVLNGIAVGAATDVIDKNGGNFVTLRPLKRVAQLEALDAAWTSGASNATTGQFIEGAGGWKRISTVAGTTIDKNVVLDLSAMLTTEYFRFFAYIQNFADANASNPILLRFTTSGGNYFQGSISNAMITKDGGMFLFFRKGDFQTVGTPNWATITNILFFVFSAAANTFAVTFDDLVRTERSQHGNGIGATIPIGGAPGDTLTATGKLWSNDAGTWKSAAIT